MKFFRWLASLVGVAALVAIGLYVFGYLRIEVTVAGREHTARLPGF